MSVDLQRGDVTIAEQPPTEPEDRRILMQGLEALASMSRGSLFHIAGTGEPIFDRLASEISAVLPPRRRAAAERQQGRSPSHRRRGPPQRRHDPLASGVRAVAVDDGEAIAGGTSSRRTVVAVRDVRPAGARHDVRAAGSRKRQGPPHCFGAGWRVRRQAWPFTIGYLVIDDQNHIAASFRDQVALSNGAGSANEPLKFVGGVLVEPGIYSLRLGVVDSEGRRGSVIRDVNAWKMAGESLALGDLIVGGMPTSGQGLTVQVEPYVLTEGVAAYLEMYSNADQTWNGTTVTFEIADNPDSPPLASLPVTLIPGRQPTWRVATGVIREGTAARPLRRARADRARWESGRRASRVRSCSSTKVPPLPLPEAWPLPPPLSPSHRRCPSSIPRACSSPRCSARCSTWWRSVRRRRSRTR